MFISELYIKHIPKYKKTLDAKVIDNCTYFICAHSGCSFLKFLPTINLEKCLRFINAMLTQYTISALLNLIMIVNFHLRALITNYITI